MNPTETLPHDALGLLIEQAWMNMQEAKAIHVQPSLATLTKQKAAEWFAATMLKVTDIKTIAGVLYITLSTLHGEMILAEGDRRGGNQKRDHATSKVDESSTLIQQHKDERSKVRALAKHKTAVNDYMEAEIKAKRAPTRHGALVHIGKVSYVPVAKTGRAPQTSARPKAPVVAQPNSADTVRARIYPLVEKVADGQRHPDRELERIVGDVLNFLKYVYLIDWLTIDRTREGTVFTIDQALRDICEGRVPRPSLEGFTWRGFLTHLRAEIARRRKENADAFRAVRWQPDEIDKRQQSNLLDWIERELSRIP